MLAVWSQRPKTVLFAGDTRTGTFGAEDTHTDSTEVVEVCVSDALRVEPDLRVFVTLTIQ